MKEQTFIVTHPKARAPLTITGKTLEEALEKESLDPSIWQLVSSKSEWEEIPSGDNQGDGREESN